MLTNFVALLLLFLLVAQTASLTVTHDVNTTMLTSETNGEDSFSVSAQNGSGGNNTGGNNTVGNTSQVWDLPISLDSTDDVGAMSSLAIDSNDNLHVTYFDNTNANLEYMTYDGSSWSTPVSLDSTDDVCLLYTSPSPRDRTRSRMPSSA